MKNCVRHGYERIAAYCEGESFLVSIVLSTRLSAGRDRFEFGQSRIIFKRQEPRFKARCAELSYHMHGGV